MKNKSILRNLLVLSLLFVVSCNSNNTSSIISSSSKDSYSSSSEIISSSIYSSESESSSVSSSSEVISISSENSSTSSSYQESSSSASSSTSSSYQESSSSISSIVEINKEELIQGYRLHISDPKLNNKGTDADDIYLKADINDNGILISMVGFGTLTDSEYVKIIIHTSENNSSGWNIQSDDVTFLVSKSKACYKTNLTKFWDYVNFTSNDVKCINTPEYIDHEQYFTLSFLIDYTEVPNYDKYKKVSMFAMEFSNGQIYDGIDYNNGMLIDGVSHGDPAAQSSYFVIQDKSLPDDQQELVANYNYQFSIDSDNIFAKFTRKTSSLVLDMLSFSKLDDTDFIRFIVHTSSYNHTSWGLDETDVSFIIYKDICYYQSNVNSFWANENNQFHGSDTTLYNPNYDETDTYWTLSIEFEYSEFSLTKNILQDTPLKGILIEFNPSIANNGFKQDNQILGDIANQENYFTF